MFLLETFAKLIDKSDVNGIIFILHEEDGISFDELKRHLHINKNKQYQYAWELANDIDDKQKIKLLELFYYENPARAKAFICSLLKQYLELLDHDGEKKYVGCP